MRHWSMQGTVTWGHKVFQVREHAGDGAHQIREHIRREASRARNLAGSTINSTWRNQLYWGNIVLLTVSCREFAIYNSKLSFSILLENACKRLCRYRTWNYSQETKNNLPNLACFSGAKNFKVKQQINLKKLFCGVFFDNAKTKLKSFEDFKFFHPNINIKGSWNEPNVEFSGYL